MYIAFRRIQDFLEAFFMFFQYKMRYLMASKKLCEGGIEKSVPRDHVSLSLGKPRDAKR